MKRKTKPTSSRKTKKSSEENAAALLGRKGGLKGGKARAAALSTERRSEIAFHAASIRWKTNQVQKSKGHANYIIPEEDLRISEQTENLVEISGGCGQWELNRIHNVNCLDGLKAMRSDCLDVMVTSPPYWGQRGTGGLGSESDPRDYIRNLLEILTEAMRCLKPSGTLWLNIGDAYNTPINWREDDSAYSTLGKEGVGLPPSNSAYTKNRGRRRACIDKGTPWLQYGNLLAIPYRVATGMCDLGFLFRGEIIWEKSRPLPEGICRRPHRRHEGIYVFAKDEAHRFRIKPPVGSVWRLLQTPNRTPHCSTFPLDLPLQCINAANPEAKAIICDPFAGSGTTCQAAQQLGYRFLGFELDTERCGMANDLLNSSNQEDLFSFGS